MRPAWSIPLFPVFGIRLELHVTFLLLLGYFAFIGAGAGGALGALFYTSYIAFLFVFVVLHELGHSLTARRYGIETRRILLLPIGGMAQMQELPRAPGKELMITLAGPLVNFVAGGLIFLLLLPVELPAARLEAIALAPHEHGWLGLVVMLGVVNVIIGLFNLIPVYPMDGGRILRALLAFQLPYMKATRWAVWVAKPLALLGAIWALTTGNLLLGLLFGFIFFAGELEYRHLRHEEAFARLSVGDATSRFFRKAPADLNLYEVARLMRYEQPPELVLIRDQRAVAVLTPQRLFELLRQHAAETPAAAVAPPARPVQAFWPLLQVLRPRGASMRETYAVYEHEHLIGVLRTDQLEHVRGWQQVQDRLDHAPPLRPQRRWPRLGWLRRGRTAPGDAR